MIETPDHHGSHQNLLWEATIRPRARRILTRTQLSALNPAAAAQLAMAMKCPLITLHSEVHQSLEGGLRISLPDRLDRVSDAKRPHLRPARPGSLSTVSDDPLASA